MPGISDKLLEKLNLFGPASQANPLRGNVFSDAADNLVSSSTAQIPGPAPYQANTDYVPQILAQHGFSGVRRSAPMKFAPSVPSQAISLPSNPSRRSLT